MGAEACARADMGVMAKELLNTRNELARVQDQLLTSEDSRKVSLAQVADLHARNIDLTGKLRAKETRSAFLRDSLEKKEAELTEASIAKKDHDLLGVGRLMADQRMALEGEVRKVKADLEKTELQLTEAKEQLVIKEKEKTELAGRLEETRPALKELEEKLSVLQNRLPSLEARAVEKFCQEEGPLLRISDSFLTGFYMCHAMALEDPINLEGLEGQSEVDLSPELEAKVAEKRDDDVAVLQLLRNEEPSLLAKWETGVGSPAEQPQGVEQQKDHGQKD